MVSAVKHTWKGKGGKLRTGYITIHQAVRNKCLECSGWSRKEVENCPMKHCPLYPFRLGVEK